MPELCDMAASSDSVIFTKDLFRSFDTKMGLVKAVDGIHLNVKHGEIFGLIGPDGAGKTTTMRLLVGAIRATSGIVTMQGINVAQNPDAVRRHIGYMPQKFSLYGDLTVDENMKFLADLYGVTGEAFMTRRRELLAFSHLDEHVKKFAKSLSGGMQKKLALSCNLFHAPDILILDEPTNGVDPVSRRELWGLLYDLLGRGTTILVSTPYMDEAERCTRISLLYDGKVLYCGTPTSLIKGQREEPRSQSLEKGVRHAIQSPFEEAFMSLIQKHREGICPL